MATSRTSWRRSYAVGHVERLAARARSFVRNEIKGRKTVGQAEFDELAGMIPKIMIDWCVPRASRERLKQSILDEFTADRPLAVLISSVEQADLRRRLRFQPRQVCPNSPTVVLIRSTAVLTVAEQ